MVMCVCCWCGCTRNAPRPAQHTRSSRAPPYTFQPSMLLLYGPAVGFTDTATYVLSVQHTHTHTYTQQAPRWHFFSTGETCTMTLILDFLAFCGCHSSLFGYVVIVMLLLPLCVRAFPLCFPFFLKGARHGRVSTR